MKMAGIGRHLPGNTMEAVVAGRAVVDLVVAADRVDPAAAVE